MDMLPTDSPPDRFRLSEWNRRISVPAVIRVLAVVIFVASFYGFRQPQLDHGKLAAIPQAGDGPEYDCFAVQLSKGHGFAMDFDDPDFRAPYEKSSPPGKPNPILNEHGAGPSAQRPPLLPAVMALCFRIFGRVFASIRIFMCVCMALAATGAFLLVAQRFGVLPGLIAAVWFVHFDDRSQLYAGMILTEAPACLVVMLMAWCLLGLVGKKSARWAIGLGAATALGFYTRAMIAFWVPVLLLVVFWVAKPEGVKRWTMRAWRLPGVFLGLYLALTGPWMIRDCVVLEQFEPLGTMGSIFAPAGYSDLAITNKGLWVNLWDQGYFKSVIPTNATPLESERIMSAYGRSNAVAWIAHHPAQLPGLALVKVQGLWFARGFEENFLLICAGLGALAMLTIRRADALCYLGLIVACTLGVAVTWTVGGRFLMPILPILAMLAAVGIWSAVIALTERPERHSV